MRGVSAQIVVGRARDSQLVIDHPTVSSRHARISWRNGLVFFEDLGSANGVWVNGQRVETALVRPGDHVVLGQVKFPWARRELKPFLRLGAQGTRIAPPGWRAFTVRQLVGRIALGLLSAAGVALVLALALPSGREMIRGVGERVQTWIANFHPAQSDEEAYIRARVARKLREAIDPSNSITRDAAIRIAAGQQGEFHLAQVAAIWEYVREHWRYVNDPNGREYFARASETITNGYVGDCDDFAITLAAMVGAIGGQARVIFMDGPRGGHAYAEACIPGDPTQIANDLARYYGRRWSRYTSAGAPQHIAFRRSDSCAVWLNLDWNANVPGGDYEPEQWTVAIYPDGHTETLAAAGNASAPVTRAGSSPQHLATPR
jgi:hypothetical protein